MIKDNQLGMALVIALVILLALTVLGIGAITTSSLDILIAGNQRMSFEALQIAEAGFDRVLSDLLRDFSINNASNPQKWADNNFFTLINGTITLTGGFASIVNDPADGVWASNGVDPYGGIQSLGDKAGYKVLILRDSNKQDEVYALIRAWRERVNANPNLVGGVLRADKKLLLYLKAENISVWDNTIFSGGGQGGKVIQGNVNVIGSVHILGTGQSGQVLAIGGGAIIGNNYDAAGLTAQSKTRLQARLPTWETDLEATIRIKNGIANISGTASFGASETGATGGKDSIAGLYISDGFGGGISDAELQTNIFADNYSYASSGRTAPTYDLGDKVQMPSLDGTEFKDPETGQPYSSYKAFVNATALVIEPDNCDLSRATFTCREPITNGVVACSTGYGNNNFDAPLVGGIVNGIAINGVTKLQASAGVPCSNGFQFGDESGSANDMDAIYYTGKGTIFTEKKLAIGRSIMPSGGTDHIFATNDILGIVTTGEMYIGESVEGSGTDTQLELMGAFFSTSKITVNKSLVVAGTIVSDQFEMNNVPTLLEVPALSENLPNGMPAGDPIYNISKIRRKELTNK